MLICVKNLKKKYGGKSSYAVEDITIEGHGGEIIGILGHNGAGKSTTIKCITGMHPYEEGSISICGYDLKTDSISAKQNFGYVSDDKRNNPELVKKCLVDSDNVDKYTLHFVGESVLDNIEFMSLYLIKLKDEDFDFYSVGEYSIDGSKMAYGKLIGKRVQSDPKFWELLNSKIKMINKKFNLDISLFDVNREKVLASRYFDDKKEKN
jgi:energy-coupling factor transporter ATP-binding protein EcfA2